MGEKKREMSTMEKNLNMVLQLPEDKIDEVHEYLKRLALEGGEI